MKSITDIIGKYPYPRKVRHHASANLYIPIKDLEYIPLYYPPLIDSEAVQKAFINKLPPSAVDIGCGKCRFLLDYALSFPNENILGLELRKVLVDWAQNVIISEKIPNAWVYWYSAVNGLDFIDEDSINYVFYLFPDPWPKQRQQRRRLFSETFLQNVYRVLKPNGLLYLATDCDYVDEFHRKLLTQTNLFEFKTTDESQWNLPKTNKELFCIEKNIKRYKLICKPRK